MAAIVSGNLAGSTITYNGVQFGGADATYASTPPEYFLDGAPVYDEAGRAVVQVDYTMTVRSTFYADSEAGMSAIADSVKERLSASGKTLTIAGIGIGLDNIQDIAWGPLPQSCKWNPWGALSWECVWVVKFSISECASGNSDPLAWAAWNYSTTWSNDFEGQCTRTIDGYVQIAGRRNPNNNQVAHVADETRERINIIVPDKFRRVQNVWRGNAAKDRIDFVVVDEQLPGDPFPAGITQATGFCSGDSQGPGFAKLNASIGMTLTTAPGVPKGLAGVICMQAFLAKQANMVRRNEGGTVIPTSMNFRAGKFDEARTTSFSATWTMTKCLNQMLNALGLWEPLVETNYQQWRTSVENLWVNRGNAGLRESAADDIVLDLCSATTTKTFGNTPSNPPSAEQNGLFSFQCPDIPPDGGWVAYDMHVHLLRMDHQTLHRKAVQYTQSSQPSSPGDVVSASGSPFNEPTYQQSSQNSHVSEFNGYPELKLVLLFKLLRFKHEPVPPSVRTVGGKPVKLISSSNESAKVAFESLFCPVWYRAGYRVYQVDGPVNVLSPAGRKDMCSRPQVSSDY